MKIDRFRQVYFEPESTPDSRTVRNWIENGDVPGVVINGRTYVDLDRWESSSFAHQHGQFDPDVADLIAKVL